MLIFERTNAAPRLVGGCSLNRQPSGAVELGYWISRGDWNRGFASEACAALVEDLDGAGVQPAGARAGELHGRASFDDGSVHPRQRQLAGQHQPRGASPDDYDGVLGHGPVPRGLVRRGRRTWT